jgi:N-methylhydantoinase B
VTAYNIGTAGMLHKDSVEIDELKHPIRVTQQRLVPDSEGAGWMRAAPAALVEFEPVGCAIEVMTNSDGHETPARGVHGGADGAHAHCYLREGSGEPVEIPGYHRIMLREGQSIISVSCSGGGYGEPRRRDPSLVAKDVREGWITPERAREIYAVATTADGVLNADATLALRGG